MAARCWIAFVLGSLLVSGLAGNSAVAAPTLVNERPAAVVGLGDSLVAGDGAGSYLPATNRHGDFCHRSSAAAIGHTVLPGVRNLTRVNLSCAGATTANVRLGGVSRNSEAPQAEQLRAVARRYDVRAVVLTVGVNDIGYANLVYDCIRAYLRIAERCATVWTPRIQSRLTATIPRIIQDIADIRQVLRDAGYREGDYTFVLQSYPSPTTGDLRYRAAIRGLLGCPVRADDGNWAKNWVAPEFTAAFARVAASTGVRLLDLAPALRGREACASGLTRAQEWSNGVTVNLAALRHGLGPNLIQESAHPNALGQAQFARCLSAFLATSRRAAKCARQPDGNLTAVPTTLSALSPFPARTV